MNTGNAGKDADDEELRMELNRVTFTLKLDQPAMNREETWPLGGLVATILAVIVFSE